MNYWSMPSLRERQKAMKEKINYVESIIKEICKYYSLTAEQVKGKSRKREIVKARFISIYIIKNETDFTLSAIGRIFNRDHSTILHSIKIINNTLTLRYDTDISDELREIKKIINNLTY
jgi:chromosomal replication initiator protein